MERLADVLKMFLEKHLIKALVSVACSLAIWLIFYDNSRVIESIGALGLVALAFCISFLFLSAVIWIYSISEEKSELKEDRTRALQNKIKLVNSMFNQLSVQEKELLLGFVRSNNKILLGYHSNGNNFLRDRRYMISTGYHTGLKDFDEDKYWLDPFLATSYLRNPEYFLESNTLVQYKLTDEFSSISKFIFDHYGKLGDF